MTLKVIGTGVGRTGTYSLKLALNQLELGPCYHMEEIILHMPDYLPGWQAAVAGKPDWSSIYDGYSSAVDWPTSGYFRELYAAYPDARFVHTVRSPQSWAASYSETIQKLILGKDDAPPQMHDWLEMASAVIERTGFSVQAKREELERAFVAHTEAVQAEIPAEQLLIFEVKDGWAPLCEFLGVSAPATSFPRSNDREGFWEKVKGAA